jgi:hypothetical protein
VKLWKEIPKFKESLEQMPKEGSTTGKALLVNKKHPSHKVSKIKK